MKEKIFEPFFRLKETEKQKGTGIGLALSRSLTELHKGVLDLKEPENNLNVFSVTIPVTRITLDEKLSYRNKEHMKPADIIG